MGLGREWVWQVAGDVLGVPKKTTCPLILNAYARTLGYSQIPCFLILLPFALHCSMVHPDSQRTPGLSVSGVATRRLIVLRLSVFAISTFSFPSSRYPSERFLLFFLQIWGNGASGADLIVRLDHAFVSCSSLASFVVGESVSTRRPDLYTHITFRFFLLGNLSHRLGLVAFEPSPLRRLLIEERARRTREV